MKVEIIKSNTGKWFQDRFNLKDLLTLSNAVTRINKGYVKKDQQIESDDNGVATKLPNLFIINNTLGIEKFKTKSIDSTLKKYYPTIEVLDEDYENVEHMVKYFKGLSLKAIKRQISDFEQTILGLIGKEFVEYKDVGVIASLPNVYANGQKQKAFNKVEKELAQTSDHVGTLHERGEFTVTFLHVKYIWRSQSYLFVCVDENNNLIKFFCNESGIKKGDTATITGYVKDHTMGKQSKGRETYLNRVKFPS
jgi:hypothetical protein